MHDVIVLGAGVAGLACARRLSGSGAGVLVLDRADKVGGRCATRWFEGVPFEYGPLFIHGHDPFFLAAARAAGGTHALEGWPHRVDGHGAPCQPEAFSPRETRMAFAEGLHSFPRSLAQGLTVRLNTQVASLAAAGSSVSMIAKDGERFEARDLVLALALEQSTPFLRTLSPDAGMDGAIGLLGMFASLPCLTVVAGYPRSSAQPEWDILYPEDAPALQLVGNESAKRPGGRFLTLACQASARWSRENLERPKEEWSRDLLALLARRLGSWAGSPEWVHAHRWRYSRLDRANELAAPLVLKLRGSRVGLAGDLFSPGGGLQAAWQSGDRLGEILARP